MARPQKEGMDYFPHDTDASNDEKIEALRSLYGNDGYAFYFIMLERIYRTTSFELDVSDAETREETFQILSRKIAVTKDVFIQILNTAVRWGCFDREWYEEKGIISSEGIKKRASVVIERRESMRNNYKMQKEIVSDAETPPETPQSKVKESKEKKAYIDDCEYLWNLYPKKDGKIPAMKKLPELIEKYSKDQMERTIKRYIESVEKQRAKNFPELKYKNGSTFFNSGYGDYLDENQQNNEKPLEPFKPTWVYREL